MKLLVPAVLTLGLLFSGCESMLNAEQRIDLLGDPAAPVSATRSIVITPETKHVNVTGGEIIQFVVEQKSFSWNFNGTNRIAPFDLNRIAPAGILTHKVMVYAAPNPLYRDDRMGWPRW